ncbi:GPO family capsid scaffolding protein [Roseateles flavus]|uniref:GPO family capsid scaffolding protein n=1 Tax=Roseateles flavus TaxID=3149041 RepID=A0ABV0GFZ6_9BURK
MAGKSKFFVVATEGGTTDGRTISRGWIEQMARTYSPKTYGARVNMEHYRGILPDGPFKAYGDVLAVKTQENDGGKLQLLAQIDPTADLIELNKKRQKVYTSIEINPNFAESGEAYLVGIAVTDSPASLGTEMLQFASKAQVNPFEARKADKGNVITEALAFSLELEEPEAKPTDNGTSLLSKVRELLSGKAKGDEQRAGDQNAAIEALATAQRDHMDATKAAITKLTEAVEQLSKDRKADSSELTKLTEQLSKAPNGQPPRPPAAGGNGQGLTDC